MTGSETVADVLAFWSTNTPKRVFLVFDPIDADPRTFTYGQMWDCACAAARMITGLGVARGDRFAVVLENGPEFFAYWFGAALTGTVLVPVNPASTADDLRYYFEHAECRAVVCCAANHETVETAWPRASSMIVTVDRVPESSAVTTSSAVAGGVCASDVLAIMYTSGTTSRPKGVMVTHANYLSAGHTVADHLRIRPDDRWMVVLPLFHANAQYYCAMSALVSGASVAVSARFSASRWGEQARRHEATLASLFAAPIRMILAAPAQRGDGDNRLRATVFAQNLTDDQIARFEGRFDVPLVQLYGMTETIAPPLMNPLYGRIDNQTIGLPTAPNRVRVIGHDGSDAAPGEIGELLVGGVVGETLMAGYLDDEQATAEVFLDGWLHTGDLVELRPDGYVAFKDRAKDMIKRSGENVAAAEVERVINTHPAVFESAVIGLPDPVYDEAIVALVVLHDADAGLDAAELMQFCAARLPRGKVPDAIEFIDALPRTSVGKIRKHVLRETRLATHGHRSFDKCG